MRTRRLAIPLVLLLTIVAAGCEQDTAKRLALASDNAAIAVSRAQDAIADGVALGVIDNAEAARVNEDFDKLAEAALVMNAVIRQNAPPATVRQSLDAVLAAFAALVDHGVAGIKNDDRRAAILLILDSARTNLAIISAAL